MLNKVSFHRIFGVLVALSLLLSAVCTPGAAAAPAQASGPQDPYEPEPARPLYGVAGVESQTNLTPEAIEQLKAGSDEAEQPEGTGAGDVPYSVIAYQRYDLDGNWDIYLTDSDSAGSRILNTPNNEIQPRLNRQSTKLAYVTPVSGHYAIYILDLASNQKTRVTYIDNDTVYPCWSPDGTKIVFEGYQNGNQGEIYVMNADGSNITRLTFNEGDANTDYDGMPAWSPDGSRIAFVSKRTGGYRVWVMNADGSNLVQLSSQPYSAHPVWSGDGAWIGYDSDGNNNGWNELWKMRSNGTEQQRVLSDDIWSNYYTEYYAGSFSPLGDTLIATQMNWRLIGTTYYVESARIVKALLYSMWHTIISGDLNMYPDWKTTDRVYPTVWITPLPAISPAPVSVEYGCNDAETGIDYCNLMVSDGLDGAWQLYDPATASALGGHSYYFRVDAMDKGGNTNARTSEFDTFTRIEDMVPVSMLEPIELVTENNSVLLSWSGYDPGGSGIASYHLQYQDPDTGIWTDYGETLKGDVQSTVFTGQGGKTYNIRLTAVDRAWNVEAWDESEIISTTLTSRRIEGQVMDAWGAPVQGAELTYNLPVLLARHTDDGRYLDLFGQDAEGLSLGVQASHPDYGALPEKNFGPVDDLRLDVYLPPVQNSLVNPGFEDAATITGWTTGGAGPALTSWNSHSGTNSVYFGAETAFTYEHLYDASDPACTTEARERDPLGNIHLLYKCFNNSTLFSLFHRVYRDGEWSAPEEIVSPGYFKLYQALFSPLGDIFVYYATQNQSYYRQYVAGEGWKTKVITQPPYDGIYDYVPELAYDQRGVLHRAHYIRGYNELFIDYSKMGRDGTWTSPERLGPFDLGRSFIAVDEYDHPFIYLRNQFLTQTPDGAWLPLQNVGYSVTGYFISKDRKIYLTGSRSEIYTEELYYALWEPISGSLLQQTYLAASIPWAGSRSILSDSAGNLTFLVKHYTGGGPDALFYTAKPADQPARKQILLNRQYRGSLQGAVDAQDNLEMYLVTPDYAGTTGGDLDNILRKPQGWAVYEEPFTPCVVPSPVSMPKIFLDGQDRLHLVSKAYDCMEQVFNSSSASATLSQTVTVPAAEESPVLSFMYEPTRTSGPGSPFSVAVIDGSQTTTVFTPQVYRSGWQHAAVDMSPWGGRQVTIQFKVQENAGAERTGIYLDEVSLGPVYADIYAPSISRDAQPGSQVTFSVAYGNQGGAPANGTMLELTLPAELSYVSASIEPIETSPALKWNLGDLARGASGTFSLTLAVADDVPLGAELSAPLSVSTSRELQTWNNTASLMVFTGHRVYMPVLRK